MFKQNKKKLNMFKRLNKTNKQKAYV